MNIFRPPLKKPESKSPSTSKKRGRKKKTKGKRKRWVQLFLFVVIFIIYNLTVQITFFLKSSISMWYIWLLWRQHLSLCSQGDEAHFVDGAKPPKCPGSRFIHKVLCPSQHEPRNLCHPTIYLHRCKQVCKVITDTILLLCSILWYFLLLLLLQLQYVFQFNTVFIIKDGCLEFIRKLQGNFTTDKMICFPARCWRATASVSRRNSWWWWRWWGDAPKLSLLSQLLQWYLKTNVIFIYRWNACKSH